MDYDIVKHMPEQLKDIIKGSKWIKDTIGCSDAHIYYLKGISNGNNAYLKILLQNSLSTLLPEKRVIEWLQGKLPVPKILYYGIHKDIEYLLISEIEGEDASSKIFKTEPYNLIRILARSLKMIHAIPIENCPFDQRLDTKLKMAEIRVEKGLVDENDFEPAYLGKTAKYIFQEVLKMRPKDEELVFTHGDYCLPNIIIKDGKLSGFIDLGRAGVADRYQDLALAVRSIEHNLGSKKWSEMFLKEYGLDNIDTLKLKYYILLDELF